jgi:Zn-dependent protease with chaperone function
MSDALLGLAVRAVLAAGAIAVGVAVLSALAWVPLRRTLASWPPASRARALLSLAAAPHALAVGLTGLCFALGPLGQVVPALDHCLTHAHDGAPHLCAAHLPPTVGHPLAWGIAAAMLLWLAVPALRQLWRERASRMRVRQLVGSARKDPARGALVVDSPVAFAAATSLAELPVVSTALLRGLSGDQLAVVLAHERAHLRRRDPAMRAWAARLASAHLPWLRRRLLAELELASEQACDEDSATAAPHRVGVAAVLLAVERLRHPELASALTGFGGPRSLEARVQALLAPPLSAAAVWSPRGLVLLAVGLTAALADPLHHALEQLVGALGG